MVEWKLPKGGGRSGESSRNRRLIRSHSGLRWISGLPSALCALGRARRNRTTPLPPRGTSSRGSGGPAFQPVMRVSTLQPLHQVVSSTFAAWPTRALRMTSNRSECRPVGACAVPSRSPGACAPGWKCFALSGLSEAQRRYPRRDRHLPAGMQKGQLKEHRFMPGSGHL